MTSSLSTKAKPQVVSYVAKTGNKQKSEHKGVQDAYLRHLMNQLDQEIVTGLSQTGGADLQREVSLLFRFDRPEIRRVVVMTEKSVIHPETGVELADDCRDIPGDPLLTRQTIQDWIVGVLQRVVSEKASSIELILVFKRQRLVGRRETLNAQAP